MDFLIRLVQVHESFRLPEIQALADLYAIPMQITSYKPDSPFLSIRLPNVSAASTLIRRSILSKSIYELWASAPDYPALHTLIQTETPHLWSQYTDSTFRFTIDTFLGPTPAHTPTQQRRIIESFSYLPLRGQIVMQNSSQTFTIFEEYATYSAGTATGSTVPILKRVYFGRKMSEGDRSAITKYDLKKRRYISTTSMDAELALITANLALAAPGKLFYDPFVGTGGFPLAAAHHGASAWGSDIDGRSIRGGGSVGGSSERSVKGNFIQYGLEEGWLDGFVADLTNSPIRGSREQGRGRWLDGIVCDPPYGVREGLKVLGCRDAQEGREEIFVDGVSAYLRPGYIPPKRPYSFTKMLEDLLNFAAELLVDEGRLAFWMPTASEASDEEQGLNMEGDKALGIPTNPRLELIDFTFAQD